MVDADVLDAVASVSVAEDTNTLTTSVGVVLRVKPVPPLLVMEAQRKLVQPEPPKYHNTDKDTWEENLDDPRYLQALEEFHFKRGEVANALAMTLGTEIVSVPDGVDKVEDTGWSEIATEFGGLEIPANGRARYFCWIKYVALGNMDDFRLLLNKIARAGTVTLEADVAQAADNFRPDAPGDTASGVRVASQNGRGNRGSS